MGGALPRVQFAQDRVVGVVVAYVVEGSSECSMPGSRRQAELELSGHIVFDLVGDGSVYQFPTSEISELYFLHGYVVEWSLVYDTFGVCRVVGEIVEVWSVVDGTEEVAPDFGVDVALG